MPVGRAVIFLRVGMPWRENLCGPDQLNLGMSTLREGFGTAGHPIMRTMSSNIAFHSHRRRTIGHFMQVTPTLFFLKMMNRMMNGHWG